jgi:hypothetical protein
VVRRRAGFAELARVVPEACGVVWKVVQSQKIAGAGRHVALYLDDVINLEVGVEMAAPFAGYGEVIGSALPAWWGDRGIDGLSVSVYASGVF